jgi:hypothetical protein
MFPQAGGVVTFIIPMWEQTLPKEFVCEDTGLRKAPHDSPHLKVNVTVQSMLL